jgi:SNF2 family DNA or RNA helicase
MEVSQGYIRIESKQEPVISDLEIVGLGMDGYITFKYKLNGNVLYYQYAPDKKIQTYLFFEIINNSPLWNFSYEIGATAVQYAYQYNNFNSHFTNIKFMIKIEPELINDYINTSLAFNFIISDIFSLAPKFTNTDLTTKSFVPYFEPIKPPATFKLKLYDYQQRTLAKMLQMEKNQIDFTVDYTFNIDFKGNNILFDPITNSKTLKQHKFKIRTNGGILSDEMGLGKTISSIALIASNPAPQDMPAMRNSITAGFDKISSRATLVVCPSHLTKQWEGEIARCNPNLKVLMILTKTDYNNLIFNDFIESDIIITSHQFIMNFKFYPTLHYQYCTASSFSFEARNASIKEYLKENIAKLGLTGVKNLPNPIFEFFHFQRLILDEGHEIFGEMLGSASLAQYMSRWVSNIDSNYYWYVSGTPFVNFTGVQNSAKFINLILEDSERDITFSYCNLRAQNKFLLNFMNKEYIWNNILEKICIRHRKSDVENQIKIPGYEERIVWLKFTDLERQLYDAKKGKVVDNYLQQLCCHPLVVESAKKIFGDVEVDLALMQDKLIEYHKSNYESYKTKLSKLDSTNPAFYMLKKTYETQMSESKYLFTILEKMKNPEVFDQENCAICMDQLDNPALTACGHLFCYECIKMCLGDKKRCPMCKADLTGKDLLVMNLKVNPSESVNPLITKYGSKLGKLISVIRHIVAQEDTRIIIFSQWDDMLSLVGKTLAENEIENCFVKGNVWSRNSAIRKFKAGRDNDGNDNKVIMLSLKNAASGTNLTEATHIFFVEPINANREESKAIEGQAIARACRVGQKRKIVLMRILISNSIEEDIYRKYYNKDIVVNFEEQSFMIEHSKEDDSSSDKLKEEEEEKPKPKIRKVVKKKVEIKEKEVDI